MRVCGCVCVVGGWLGGGVTTTPWDGCGPLPASAGTAGLALVHRACVAHATFRALCRPPPSSRRQHSLPGNTPSPTTISLPGNKRPQLVQCESGVYAIGTEHHFRADNNVVVSRMLDDRGAAWSAPVRVSQGWSVVAANTGVDVSRGRVTKTFEMIPSMATPVAGSRLREPVTLPFRGGPGSPSWQHSPVLELAVESVEGFVPFTLVQAHPTPNATAPEGGAPAARDAFFFRILAKDGERGVLTVRLERFNHYWATSPVTLVAGQAVSPGSGSNVYGGVDWVAMAMSADEAADLTDPAAWTFSEPLGNPASVYANEMRVLFDVAFRPDRGVQEGIVGRPLEAIRDNEQAFEAGFGSLYWMEGVVTRLQDRHGGPGTLLSIMRVNNDLMCDLAALVEFDDRDLGGKGLASRFLRYTNIPGLAVGHPAILYDNATDLYWMASNANRDSVRAWRQPKQASDAQPSLHITPFSKCEVDRSTLVLYYSPNLVDWADAGVIDYHIKLGRHFAYPHMTIDGTPTGFLVFLYVCVLGGKGEGVRVCGWGSWAWAHPLTPPSHTHTHSDTHARRGGPAGGVARVVCALVHGPLRLAAGVFQQPQLKLHLLPSRAVVPNPGKRGLGHGTGVQGTVVFGRGGSWGRGRVGGGGGGGSLPVKGMRPGSRRRQSCPGWICCSRGSTPMPLYGVPETHRFNTTPLLQGPYSGPVRKSTNSVTSLVQTLLPRSPPPPPPPQATPVMELGQSASREEGNATDASLAAGDSRS